MGKEARKVMNKAQASKAQASSPVQAGFASSKQCSILLILAFGTALSACAETGDLGRPRNSLWNNTIYPLTGYATAHLPREQVSSFHLTDDETRLRDRAYHFNAPQHEKMGFFEGKTDDVTAYHRALTTQWYASQVSRYRRLADDAESDRMLITPIRTLAGRVVAADDARLRTAALSPRVDDAARVEADKRVTENREVVAKVRERVRARVSAYRYALDNLVVEVPSKEAIAAERAVMALESEITLLDRIPVVPLACEACAHLPGSLAGANFAKDRPPVYGNVPHVRSRITPPVVAKN